MSVDAAVLVKLSTAIDNLRKSVKDAVSNGTSANSLKLEGKSIADVVASVTKTTVGLNNVSNYAPADETDATQGSANNKYMTPLRTTQLVNAVLSNRTYDAATLQGKTLQQVIDAAKATVPASILNNDTLTGNLNGAGFNYRNLLPAFKDYGNVSGNVSIDLAQAPYSKITVTAATTVAFANLSSKTGTANIFNVMVQGGGSFPVTWPAAVVWDENTAPTLAAGSKKTVLTFTSLDGGSTLYGSVQTREVA